MKIIRRKVASSEYSIIENVSPFLFRLQRIGECNEHANSCGEQTVPSASYQ